MGRERRLVERIGRSDQIDVLPVAGDGNRLLINRAVMFHDIPEFFICRERINQKLRGPVINIGSRYTKEIEELLVVIGSKCLTIPAHDIVNGQNSLAAPLIIHGSNVIKLKRNHHIMGDCQNHGQVVRPRIFLRDNNRQAALFHGFIRLVDTQHTDRRKVNGIFLQYRMVVLISDRTDALPCFQAL